ncbi:DUF222 domain-containing protein, partial [Mycolicibacterium porcinum]|uniref:HNH endonuclease signature motif containing protein n=1 Tax=Mycolicibacterium porcinum TaxID=39693 RepID=UPI001194FA10
DGLVHIQGWLDPETAAYLTTVTGVWGAPGINNPADAEPVHNPTPNPFEDPTDADVPAPDMPETDIDSAEPQDCVADAAGAESDTSATESGTEAEPVASQGQAAPNSPDPETQAQGRERQEQAAARDTRTQAQRNHDALKAALREVLMSKRLGQHGGLPVTVVVSTTLAELEAGAGIAVTGSGLWMPMTDLIRLAEHSYHYLTVYKRHTAEPLYMARTKRLATKAQRLLLYNRDRGCTRPGCTAPADRCEVHHAQADWQHGGQTNAPDLGLGCGPDNRLVGLGWTTTIDPDTGRIHWHPPPLMNTGQDTLNHHFHP